jgi:hypothetical protein
VSGGEEVDRQPIMARCHSSEVLQAAEHALDGVSGAINDWRETVSPTWVSIWREVRHGTFSLDPSADGVGTLALVAVQDTGVVYVTDERLIRQAVQDSPQVSMKAIGRHSELVMGIVFVLRLPRERPIA